MICVERRRGPRIPVQHTASVVQEIAETGERIEGMGTTTDISEGGLRFQGSELFDPNHEVQVQLVLGESVIDAKGRVVHLTINSRGAVAMGIQFNNLQETHRRCIQQYCHEMAQHALGPVDLHKTVLE